MKIAVVQKDFYTGGIPSSCISFLNCMSKESWCELTLFTFDKIKDGLIPNNVNIVYTDKHLNLFAISNAESKKRGLFFRIRWLLLRVWCKFFTNKIPLRMALRKQNKIEEEFDIAISFAPSSSTRTLSVGTSEFVLEKLKAKKKVVLYHNDFSSSGLNTKFVVDGLSKFDKILCVSKSCAENMRQALPNLNNKIDFLYNFVDAEKIKQKAVAEQVLYPSGVINIVSVSRLSEEKAHMRSLEVFKELREEYKNFIWHIVGDGKERASLEQFVAKNDMQDYVRFYGNQENPYPYIKSADLLYLGSYHESFGLVLVEAFILGVPVVTTETRASNEVVGNFGFICENSKNGILGGLAELLCNNEKVKLKTELLKNYKYDNAKIVEKIKELGGFIKE